MDKVLTVAGRTFIGAGVLVFLFVGYQLWGTGITEAREQNRLQAEAVKAFSDAGLSAPGETPAAGSGDATSDGGGDTGTNTGTQTQSTVPAPPPAPSGSAVAVIKIPKIGLQKAVVAGTSVDDLKKGPGHYAHTPLPGQPGNAAIAGHRTTYGAPFQDIDRLGRGDVIEVSTRQGTFRYIFREQHVVNPEDVHVLDQGNENILTLTTCHPKFSAAKRLIVTATLDTSPAPAATPVSNESTNPPNTSQDSAQQSQSSTTTTQANADSVAAADAPTAGLSGEDTSSTPAFVWGAIAFLIGLAVALLARLFNKWLVYGIGAIPFLLVLFIFFENFSRLLPANA